VFSDWGARGGWADGYGVFAMVADNHIIGTVGRQSMRYVINDNARSGYQIGAVATHSNHRNPRTGSAADERGIEQTRCARSASYSVCEPERARLLSAIWVSQARARPFHRACQSESYEAACADSEHHKANRPRMASRSLRQSRFRRPGLCCARLLPGFAISSDMSAANGLQAGVIWSGRDRPTGWRAPADRRPARDTALQFEGRLASCL
jgi:hypothetical protein